MGFFASYKSNSRGVAVLLIISLSSKLEKFRGMKTGVL